MVKEKEPKQRRKPGRVPTSCAECRRLKLRCDRNVPCEKCVSRGCGSICPDGELAAGKGNRLVLANTEELHDRIEHLCSRIRELENALRTLQETVSEDPHPLLRQDLLQVKAPQSSLPSHISAAASSIPTPSPYSTNGHVEPQEKTEDENFLDAFGTLTIGLHGESNFLGKTARSEYLIRALSKPQHTPSVVLPRLPKRMMQQSCVSDEPSYDETLGGEIFALLPPLSEAIHLCEVYLQFGKALYTAIPRTELFDEILSSIYRADSFDTVQCYHSLATIFIIFALACLFDSERHPYSVEAQEYYYLSRAALQFTDPNGNNSLRVVQSLIHIAQYQEYSDWEALGSNSPWRVLSMAVNAGYGIGLHLNSSRWKLSDDVSQRRARVFWQLFTLDTCISFHFGRPPGINLGYVDCALPKDTDENVNPDGSKDVGYHTWSWQYMTLMHNIMATAFGSKTPPYSVIVDLDRRVRDFPVPSYLRWDCSGQAADERHTQRWQVISAKESTLLNLHRAYFAQALQDQPNDLTNHRYVPSVMATFRSAWRLSKSLRFAWSRVPHIVSRLGIAWSQALSAAIVMTILITRAPTSKMTKSSLEELDDVAILFEEAAPTCRSAANLLETICNLRRKAHAAVDKSLSQDPNILSPSELDRLGGKTHLISQLSSETSSPVYPYPTPTQTPPQPTARGTENMHPTIAQDMRDIDIGHLVHNFFDPPTTELLQTTDEQQMQDVHFAESLFNQQPTMSAFSGMGNGSGGQHTQQQQQQPSPVGFGTGAPILDATWQSFVEQLGF